MYDFEEDEPLEYDGLKIKGRRQHPFKKKAKEHFDDEREISNCRPKPPIKNYPKRLRRDIGESGDAIT